MQGLVPPDYTCWKTKQKYSHSNLHNTNKSPLEELPIAHAQEIQMEHLDDW